MLSFLSWCTCKITVLFLRMKRFIGTSVGAYFFVPPCRQRQTMIVAYSSVAPPCWRLPHLNLSHGARNVSLQVSRLSATTSHYHGATLRSTGASRKRASRLPVMTSAQHAATRPSVNSHSDNLLKMIIHSAVG